MEPTEATEPVETAEPTEPEEPTEVLPEVTVEVMTEPVETEQPDEQVPEEIPSEPVSWFLLLPLIIRLKSLFLWTVWGFLWRIHS